jgi:hypothetical protein
MSGPKMLILRGNAAPAGNYPDEQGKVIAWPIGSDPVVLDQYSTTWRMQVFRPTTSKP